MHPPRPELLNASSIIASFGGRPIDLVKTHCDPSLAAHHLVWRSRYFQRKEIPHFHPTHIPQILTNFRFDSASFHP